MKADRSGDELSQAPGAPANVALNRDLGLQLSHARHELRTPLNAIIGYAELLLDDAESDTTYSHDLTRILHDGHRMLVAVDTVFQSGVSDEAKITLDRRTFEDEIRDGFRTPLNSVIGYAEMLLEQPDPSLTDLAAKTDLERIRDAALRLHEQLNEILSRAEVGADTVEIEIVDRVPIPVVDDVERMLSKWQISSEGTDGRFLVVDDSATSRDLLARHLGRAGFHVTAVENGKLALEELKRNKYDLVFLDILMPELNGLQVLERLRSDERIAETPVIVISAMHESESVAPCIEMGAVDYLTKPFDPVLLGARVRATLEKNRLREREKLYNQQIENERARSEELLRVMFPEEIVAELRATERVRARRHDEVAVLFCDVVGFTSYCDGHRPEEVLLSLQEMVHALEHTTVRYDLLKIKTIGDCFMATSGLLNSITNPVENAVKCAYAMLEDVRSLRSGWQVRIGIHCGAVMAGVVGSLQYSFDIWGDTVNTADRVQRHGRVGSVNLSDAAWARISDMYVGESLGRVGAKGKESLGVYALERQ